MPTPANGINWYGEEKRDRTVMPSLVDDAAGNPDALIIGLEANVELETERGAVAILEGKNVASDVARFRQRFTTMNYCLPEKKARPLIEKLLAGLLKS